MKKHMMDLTSHEAKFDVLDFWWLKLPTLTMMSCLGHGFGMGHRDW